MALSILWVTLASRALGPGQASGTPPPGEGRRPRREMRPATSAAAGPIRRRLRAARRIALRIVPVFAMVVCVKLAANAEGLESGGPVVSPVAAVETEPVASRGDAADDPAIWIHPDDPARSLVLGTDKKGGLNVFDLDGRRLQVVSDGSRPNNVDILGRFPLGGKPVDLAVAGTRTPGRFGVAFWRIDPASRRLREVGPVPAFPVLGEGEPYGLCAYRSPKDGAFHVFVTGKDGKVEQYRLAPGDGPGPGIRATLVRTLRLGSQAEGCVADDDLGDLYVGEEDVGIWKFGAEPDAGSTGTLIARVGEHGLAADVEGLTIYYAQGSRGYLIASSQGNSTYKVYDRRGSNPFVLTIDPRAGSRGDNDPGETDGIDVTSAGTSPRFARGLFVCQDGLARDGRQNFKFFAWDEIAGDRLIVDPGRPPHGR